MKYYISYNCKFIDCKKSIKAALNVIRRKGLRDDYNNQLYIIDTYGNVYDPETGQLTDIY